jgi:tetratricopeptide (TPR) repeat protein
MSSNENLIQGLSEQYGAGLKMLENIIKECNDKLWEDYNQEIIISQVVYHALSSTDFYLSRTKQESDSFKAKYGDDDSFNNKEKKFTKKQLLEYLEEIKVKSNKRFKDISIEELNDKPIFDWHGTSVLGSLLYNLRHVMLHVGALHVRVNAAGKEPLPWVSKIYGDERDLIDEQNRKGVTLLQSGKLDEAEKIYLELIKDSENPLFYYNLACCYSRQKKPEKALDTLKTCLKYDTENRFKDLSKKDADFANIRELPGFKELMNN